MNDLVGSTTPQATFGASDKIVLTSPDLIRADEHSDPYYNKIIETIQKGFPKMHRLTALDAYKYWEVRHRLSADNNLEILDQRIVIPTFQRAKVFCWLHSAHQSKIGMKARANESVN